MGQTIRILFRQPLLQFGVLGTLLFVLSSRAAPPPNSHVLVPAAFVAALAAEHKERTGRDPTAEERQKLVDKFVSEELLYREALSQGLDRGDMIVRRRLVQKMELLSKALVGEPSEAELLLYLNEHTDRYRTSTTLSFRHVFVSRQRSGGNATPKANEMLMALRRGESPTALGEAFLQGASFARKTAADVNGTFGPGFAEKVMEGPSQEWFGPVSSSFGEHLVFVDGIFAAQAPALSAVRGRVREDLLKDRRDSAVDAEVARLREKYKVEVEFSPR